MVRHVTLSCINYFANTWHNRTIISINCIKTSTWQPFGAVSSTIPAATDRRNKQFHIYPVPLRLFFPIIIVRYFAQHLFSVCDTSFKTYKFILVLGSPLPQTPYSYFYCQNINISYQLVKFLPMDCCDDEPTMWRCLSQTWPAFMAVK